MPRPKTKSELLTGSRLGYETLIATVDAFVDAQQIASFPFDHRDKNIRDVLAHLHEWQVMMLTWYETGMAGSKPDMPANGYTWKTTAELNYQIWRRYQDTPLKQIRSKLDRSQEALCKIIASHTDAELYTKSHYSWTGTTSLGSYITSATCSHYDWAMKLLRRYVRSLQKGRA